MKQNTLFDYKETSNKFDLQQKMEIPWYEDTICKDLEFIAVPFAVALGAWTLTPQTLVLTRQTKMRLVRQLLWPLKKSPVKNIDEQISLYLKSESKHLRKDHTKRLHGNNQMSEGGFIDLLAHGALELSRRSKSLQSFKRSLRQQLPVCPYTLKFSRLGRYLLNGAKDEFWYRDTGTEIANLFSAFDPELITSLLAITSIRSTVSTNAMKFFKALQQFYETNIYTVLIGERKNKQKIQSSFQGLLDASIIHLNKLKSGESLVNSDQKNARKIRMFASAMLDNIEAIVADIWIMRSFGCDLKYFYGKNLVSRSPTRSLYDAIEWYFQVLGGYIGKEPRGVCSMVWSGIRSETTSSSTRYSATLKARLSHGLFAEQYGKLVLNPNGGIKFEEL